MSKASSESQPTKVAESPRRGDEASWPQDLEAVDDQVSFHLEVIGQCARETDRYGRLLLATPRRARYPYVYPRDCSCACQLLRRIAVSERSYEAADEAFELLRSTAEFIRDVQDEEGCWGQRYTIEGHNKSIYRQEDNLAHGVSILCNYLLAALRRGEEVAEPEPFLRAINAALRYALQHLYHRELNLFRSTTAIHESALESGYTLWVNFSYLYAFSLADEVDREFDDDDLVSDEHLRFREHFLHSVSELFMTGQRYVRRIEPEGRFDLRPDVTLLSPFYYGFLDDEVEQERSLEYLKTHLRDPELGLFMRYLPFDADPATHTHAGNGPWLQYSAWIAQYHYFHGERQEGDDVLQAIDAYRNERGEIPEHLSTARRFDDFMEREWRSGLDFAKEFDEAILRDGVSFDLILEEANNMQRSYDETGIRCRVEEECRPGGGYIRFATPLMWSHAEYCRAVLVRAGDWWKMA